MRPEKIQGNVFVAKLPHGLMDEQLAEAFDPYGLVLTAHLARDPVTGASLGHGLVQIAPDHAVEKAIAGLEATGIGGRRVEVRRADPVMAMVVSTKTPRTPEKRVEAGRLNLSEGPAKRLRLPRAGERESPSRVVTLRSSGGLGRF